MKVIIFTLYLISVTGESTNEVTAYSGGGVRIKCKYHKRYETNNKYFCKGESTPCDIQIKTDIKNTWVHEGRFSLYDNTSAKFFWVLMRNLTVEDTGTYQCAVDKFLQTDKYTAVKVKVIAAGGVASKEVTAYAGGGVNIKCKYEDEYKTKLKSFCKIGNDHWCLDQITNPNTDWTHQLRSSVHDNRSAGFFSVFIRELSVNDSGTYQCGVAVSDQLHTYTEVKVNVPEDLNYGRSISETGYRGGTVNISCKYPESQRSDPKFLCKIVGTDVCAYKMSVKESGRWINEGYMSLYDDRTTLLFTVTIRELTGSGTYWCGAESDWESDHGYKVYITQIYLTVTEPQVPVPSVSSSCSSPRSTVLTTSKTTVTSSPTTDTSTGLAMKLYKMKNSKTQASFRTQLGRNQLMDNESRPSENQLEMSTQPVSLIPNPYNNQSRSVYQNLEPNTNQSHSVYHSLDPNANQSHSMYQSLDPNANQSHSMYQSLAPNTNQSHSIYQSLAPNANQSHSIYQSLDPNTIHSNSTYQHLDPNTNQTYLAFQNHYYRA
ncbi:polymeric immunoglobulin receptor-like isoform X2 [Brachyhypopomus gauderio]|uniref:polymeric immunoglobulin receptor-like isoform X2 n=1 Tax=Brachyhypopomus gauderio TaxID=698409 RepID=UPI0040439474